MFIPDRVRIRRPEDCDRRGEDQPWPVSIACGGDRVEQQPHAIQVGAVALVKIGLRLAGNNGSQMEDDVGQAREQFLPDARLGQIDDGVLNLEARGGRRRGLDDIREANVRDALAREGAIACEALDELATEHACCTHDQDPHSRRP